MVPKVYTSLRFPLPLPWNTFWPRNPGVRGFDYDPIGLANALDTSAEFEILRIQNLWQCVRCWFRVPRSSILIYFYASILLSGYLLEFIWRLLLLLQHQQPKIYGVQVAGHRVDRRVPQWMQ